MAVVVAFAAATILGLFALWVSARRAITICVIQVDNGQVDVRQGSLGPRLLSDVRDIVRRPKVKSATIRLSRAKDFAKVEASGALSKEQKQQLQNLIGNIPVAKLLAARGKA
jgi:hypothetical protein